MDWARAEHPHALHLERALHWLVASSSPTRSAALRIAALLHDIERAFPDPDSPFDGARRLGRRTPTSTTTRRAARSSSRRWLIEHRADPTVARDAVAARPVPRGGRLARGRPAAGGGLALLHRDDDAADHAAGSRRARRPARARWRSSSYMYDRIQRARARASSAGRSSRPRWRSAARPDAERWLQPATLDEALRAAQGARRRRAGAGRRHVRRHPAVRRASCRRRWRSSRCATCRTCRASEWTATCSCWARWRPTGAVETDPRRAAAAGPRSRPACGLVANERVRNQATIGGVLADADYASDPPALLSALGARRSCCAGPGGRRAVPVRRARSSTTTRP